MFTIDDAKASGLSEDQAWRLVQRGLADRLHQGVFSPAGTPDTPARRLMAAHLAAGRESLVSHRSAAWLWGIGERRLEVVELVVPLGVVRSIAGVTVHRCRDLDRTYASARLGIPCTNPLRTLVDLGAVWPRGKVKDALDRAIAARLFTVRGVLSEVDRVGRPGRQGAGVLRRILAELGVGANRPPSVLEARTRALFKQLDLDPVCELKAGRDGEYRLDFAFPEAMLVVEVDGWEVHASNEAQDRDYLRQNALSEQGWCFLRYTWNGVVRRPAKFKAEVGAVYRARARL